MGFGPLVKESGWGGSAWALAIAGGGGPGGAVEQAKEKGGQRGSARLVPEARNEQAADAAGSGEQLAGSA